MGTSLDGFLQNKENIPPIFNYLAPSASIVPTPNGPISPPPKSPLKSPVLSGPLKDYGVQTEPFLQEDREIQTDPITIPDNLAEAYHDLAARYDVLRDELNTYKSAHEELQGKYLKNKKVWEAWTKSDAERREQSKKRRREGSAISEAGGREIAHGYTTPARSIAGHSPYSRPPPTLSPNKPMFESPTFHPISKKPGLFADLKGSLERTSVSDNPGVGIGVPTSVKSVETEDVVASEKRIRRGPERNDNTFRPLPVPKTSTLHGATINLKTTSRGSSKGSPTPNTSEKIDDTDGESSGSRSDIVTPTARPLNHPEPREKGPPVLSPRSDPVFQVPKIKKEKPDAKRTRSGDSVIRPVVIKSEPSAASSEGFGYHLFEEESLDLDDIGYKPETPRKRQKFRDSSIEDPISSGSSGRVGWINGGFTIKRVSRAEETQYPDGIGIEETQDEDEGLMFNQEECLVPISLPPKISHGELGGVGTDFRLGKPQAPLGAVSATPSTISRETPITAPPENIRNKVIEDKENQPGLGETRISPPPLGNWRTPMPNQPLTSTSRRRGLPILEESTLCKQSSQKSRGRRRLTSSDAIASIAEDGTYSTEDVGSDGDFPHPPITVLEKQGGELEGTTRLSKILNSPAPKTPTLAHLKGKMDISKSAPTKKPLSKTFEKISSSEPPKRKAWVDPMRYTKGRQAERGPRDLSKLDISHFRVNPDMNEGRDYAFAETVRSREARKCLPGCAKTCCRELVGFVEAAGLPLPAPRGPRWRSSSPLEFIDEARERAEQEPLDKKFAARFGKHRDAFARRRSPPGFWDADFPDTQDIEKQIEAAEDMRMQKVEEMRREAEKGGKGRYVYKD